MRGTFSAGELAADADRDTAAAEFQKAANILTRLVERRPESVQPLEDLANVLTQHGILLLRRGDSQESEIVFARSQSVRQQVVVILEKQAPDDVLFDRTVEAGRRLANAHMNCGSVDAEKGDFTGALKAMRLAQFRRKELLSRIQTAADSSPATDPADMTVKQSIQRDLATGFYAIARTCELLSEQKLVAGRTDESDTLASEAASAFMESATVYRMLLKARSWDIKSHIARCNCELALGKALILDGSSHTVKIPHYAGLKPDKAITIGRDPFTWWLSC